MVQVNCRLTKLHFFKHFGLQLVNRLLFDAGIGAPTLVFSDWLSVWPKLSSAAMTSPPLIMHQGPYGPTQPSWRTFHGFCNRKTTPSWYLLIWCIDNYEVLQCILSSSFVTANFDNRSEALTEFSIIIFLKWIPPWQNNVFTWLKFFFIANKKQKQNAADPPLLVVH